MPWSATQVCSTLFALDKSWINAYSSSAPFNRSRPSHSVLNERAGFSIQGQILNINSTTNATLTKNVKTNTSVTKNPQQIQLLQNFTSNESLTK
jgi:hypothetical protein